MLEYVLMLIAEFIEADTHHTSKWCPSFGLVIVGSMMCFSHTHNFRPGSGLRSIGQCRSHLIEQSARGKMKARNNLDTYRKQDGHQHCQSWLTPHCHPFQDRPYPRGRRQYALLPERGSATLRKHHEKMTYANNTLRTDQLDLLVLDRANCIPLAVRLNVP